MAARDAEIIRQWNVRPVVRAPQLAVDYVEIPGGEDGTRATLEAMAKLAREAPADPETGAELCHWARAMTRHVGSKDYEGEARAIFDFVRRHVRYRQDPVGLERVQAPYWTLLVDEAGDCDDHATLIASLALCLGHAAALRAVKVDHRRPQAYSHVYALIGVPVRFGPDGERGIRWLAADTTQRQATLGWEPPRAHWHGEPMDVIVAAPVT